MDPDGRVVIPITNKRLANAIMFLYSNSETFKQQFNILLSDTNSLNQKAVTIFTTEGNKYLGNTQTNDSPISDNVEMLRLAKNGEIERYIEKRTDKNIQAIFVNIDIEAIEKKKINLLEVISEEVCHAADTMNYGSEGWNEKCKREDSDNKYNDRPREIYAKELAKKIMGEINE